MALQDDLLEQIMAWSPPATGSPLFQGSPPPPQLPPAIQQGLEAGGYSPIGLGQIADSYAGVSDPALRARFLNNVAGNGTGEPPPMPQLPGFADQAVAMANAMPAPPVWDGTQSLTNAEFTQNHADFINTPEGQRILANQGKQLYPTTTYWTPGTNPDYSGVGVPWSPNFGDQVSDARFRRDV
jgi:hypothetical protein